MLFRQRNYRYIKSLFKHPCRYCDEGHELIALHTECNLCCYRTSSVRDT